MFKNTKTLVMLALFIALQILFTRVLSVETPFIRLSFAFLPIAVSGIMFGPVTAGFAALIADVVGIIIIPPVTGAVPHWGFSLSAFLTGSVYGLMLYKRGHSLTRITIACAIHLGVIAMILNSLWLSQIWGTPFIPTMLGRLLAQAVLFPIQIITIRLVWRYLGRYLERSEAVAL